MSDISPVKTFNSRIYNDPIINNVAVKKNKKFEIKDFPELNAAEITLTDESHTFGNLIRKSLLQDPQVQFAGYRIPHPLENRLVIKLKLKDNAKSKPLDVFINNLNNVKVELKQIQNEFEEAFSK